ncbi:MAG: hypothetical protein EOO03_15325, partial [Chitinophagaceae bacterium]
MKKILTLLLATVCLSQFLQAQSVAINTDGAQPHNSAALDIKSTAKGILIPRLTSAQRTGIATPAAGLLVYDTDNNSFWFFNGNNWITLAAPSGGALGGWSLSGNSGTDSTVQFIGTTDLKPLVFRCTWVGRCLRR